MKSDAMTGGPGDTGTHRIDVVNMPIAGGNPYQRLLYSAPDSPFDLTTGSRGGFAALAAECAAGGPKLLHLHWDDRIFGRSKDLEENHAHTVKAFEDLCAFRDAGGRILWTVHNRLPHKQIDLDTFHIARQALCDLVDLIHVHAPHAADYLVEEFDVDRSKIRVIAHPSYLGAYESAEATLNRPMAQPNARSFLFFGMFRGDKGVAALAGAARKLSLRDHKYTLRMYGKAFGSQSRLLRRLGWNPNIELRTERIPDDEIPAIFGAAQVFVAPFDSMFTSGTVMLAQTFGLPVVGPDTAQMRQSVPEDCYDMLYAANAPRGLIRKMAQVIAMPDDELIARRRACFDYAKRNAPELISARIAEALEFIKDKEYA